MLGEIEASEVRELREIARFSRDPTRVAEGRDRLIRFLDAHVSAGVVGDIVDSLCVHFGLFPYVTSARDSLSTAEALALEFHRPATRLGDGNFVFHSDQAAVFYRLLDGENIILSAPTSFGKSVILDALVQAEKWNNIVVIVPTVALIDEVRRRVVRFSHLYNVITHPTQESAARNIYVLTQERFLELPEIPDVDLFMIDEFYKLGSHNPDDQRMSMLNIAWNRLRATGAQYYLTGPNVDRLAETLSSELRETLYVSNYRTVSVDVENRSAIPDEERVEDMSRLWATLEGPTLLFVSAPARAERTAIDVSEFTSLRPPSEFAIDVSDWLAKNFHPDWRVVRALGAGVATHTGPMPRSLQRIMVRLFAQESVSTLVCTSTLIEGVNTSAKNVIIFDKKIDRKPIDYFTYSNVRGRAGRMASHFLGRVITYMSPPKETAMEVDIPIDSQSSEAPLSAIVQLSDAELSRSSRERLRDVMVQSALSIEVIRANRGFDPDLQIEAARLLRVNRKARDGFVWSGYPTNLEARKVLEFGFMKLLSPSQRRGMNFERLWGMIGSVRDARGDLSALVERQFPYKFPTDDLSDVVASVLAFQRNWMGFTIPSLLRAVQAVYNDVARSLGEGMANYTFYISQVESLFLPKSLLDLDEYGLPLPLALRLSALGMKPGEDTAGAIRSFVNTVQKQSVRAALSDVEIWIIDDVLDGLGIEAENPILA